MKKLIEKYKRIKERYEKLFTMILRTSRFIVFASLIYVAVVMYKIHQPIESIIVLVVATLYIILNKLDQIK